MSFDKCTMCGAYVNTDDDPGCYDDVSVCVCERCRDEYLGEKEFCRRVNDDCKTCGNNKKCILTVVGKITREENIKMTKLLGYNPDEIDDPFRPKNGRRAAVIGAVIWGIVVLVVLLLAS